MKKVFTKELAGRELKVTMGEWAQLANASVLIQYGDTTVLSTATASPEPKPGIDFFPLSVDYEEKMYAVGRFPGGFLKREGRPSEHATVTARTIDRGLRPMFPSDLRNDVVLSNTVLVIDEINAPEFCATFGSSLALAVSDIPFNGPVANINVGLIDGEIIINPTVEQQKVSDLDLALAGRRDKLSMIEAGANEVPDEKMLECIAEGQKYIAELCDFIDEIVAEVGKEKFEYTSHVIPEELMNAALDLIEADVKRDMIGTDKDARDEKLLVLSTKLNDYIVDTYGEESEYIDLAPEVFDLIQKKVVRDLLKEGVRVDGRAIDEIRPLSAEVDVLPRVHGSSVFSRGETQALNIVTLQPISKAQVIDGLGMEEYKRYIHHYNFPAYSVGEARASRSPGRREIGHGQLAEKALYAVLPAEEDFPYAIRSVSEILSSNGSTSQASVCSSCMSLMAAGVPLTRHVAGISTGLISNPEDDDDFTVFMDLQGVEDFYGDMDFKVAGTSEGITAIQVDIKNDGLTQAMIEDAFAMTRKGRLQIINEVMAPAISGPREELAEFAPKIIQTKVPVDKIGEVIGKGGKTINEIIERTGATIEIDDDGTVFISGLDLNAMEEAKLIVEGIVTEPEAGQVYEGQVTRIESYGAFVEYLPSKEGLVHISKLSWDRVNDVNDVLSIGDIVKVKIMDIDDRGRVDLSIRDLTDKPEGFAEESPRNDRNDRNDRNHRNYRNDRNDRNKRRDFGDDQALAKPRKPRQRRDND
ncbi:polyribonucleotide nucleotidyltransferase [Fastidiosipila sanguinis]|uniref:Polyribonucleotide nucleotidyltransferase n=1 Tax=Fastidiosipila sanguinis TaxID=236753 RepID=A0A2S0KMI9_9FIRM|nr:polyribonucleotide nucleotidyltransferase [Fastidiosipila sanguinis]AVM42251.1 polyribonucleotide nucleotidyltransferase [Fastidiosipila sanguinis]